MPALTQPAVARPTSSAAEADLRPLLLRFGVCVALLTACFVRPLSDLVRYALRYDLYSHVLLIPLVSVYIAWLGRDRLRAATPRPAWTLVAFTTLIGSLSLGYAVLG